MRHNLLWFHKALCVLHYCFLRDLKLISQHRKMRTIPEIVGVENRNALHLSDKQVHDDHEELLLLHEAKEYL